MSQFVSALICFLAIVKVDVLHIHQEDFHHNGRMVKELMKLSIPLSLNNMIIGLGGLGVQ